MRSQAYPDPHYFSMPERHALKGGQDAICDRPGMQPLLVLKWNNERLSV